jgi:chromosome segregation ATPase
VEERGALEDQKREFRTARSEITVLQSRIEELESSEEVAEKNTHIEMEHLKETYQLELAGLRAEIDKQQLALEERQTTIQALQKEHKDERQRLEAQVAEQRSLADRSDAECRENRLAIAALREEMARTEFALRQTEMLATAQAEQLREQFKSEVAALEAQLMAKEETLKAVTEQARELESTNSAKIEELHKEHSEKQSLIKSRNAEMSELRSQITDLLEKIGDLERANREGLEKHRIATTDLEQSLRLQINELQNQLADNQGVLAARNDKIQQLQSQVSQAGLVVKQAETKAADAIEKIRRESESQMESLQAKIHGKLEDIQRREASVCSTEQSFQAEINALRSEVAEKHSLLENRNDELLRVKTETDGLQERIVYLESVASEAELETPDKSDTSDQAEFERLWNELGETEQVLEQLRAAVNDAGSDVHAAPIINLDSELVDKDAMPENLGNGFPRGDSKLTGTQKEKLIRLGELVETIKADNEQTLSPRNRRWRFSLSGRKRRWKS